MDYVIEMGNTRRSFRRRIVSGTTRARVPCMATRTDRHCLAADTAGLPPAFYSEHTPRLTRLKHQADKPGTGYHTGGMSPSPVIHVHHTIGHVA